MYQSLPCFSDVRSIYFYSLSVCYVPSDLSSRDVDFTYFNQNFCNIHKICKKKFEYVYLVSNVSIT